MQRGGGNLSHSKHRSIQFHRMRRERLLREMAEEHNEELERKRTMKRKRRQPMFATIREAFEFARRR